MRRKISNYVAKRRRRAEMIRYSQIVNPNQGLTDDLERRISKLTFEQMRSF